MRENATLSARLFKVCATANTAIPAPVPSGGRGGGCGKDAPLVAAVAGAVEDVGAGVDDGRGRPGVPVPHNGVEGGSGAQDPHSLDLVDLKRCECIINLSITDMVK